MHCLFHFYRFLPHTDFMGTFRIQAWQNFLLGKVLQISLECSTQPIMKQEQDDKLNVTDIIFHWFNAKG